MSHEPAAGLRALPTAARPLAEREMDILAFEQSGGKRPGRKNTRSGTCSTSPAFGTTRS